MAWSRRRDHIHLDRPERVELTDARRAPPLDPFHHHRGVDGATVVPSLAGPLLDRLPREAALDADHRIAPANVLGRWITFALTQRGVDPTNR